tara:strand:+ start:1687 stop:3237 length:1551 start_codon:yes stop_codon:yes gene_type:complete
MSELKQLSGQDASFIYLDTDRASTGGTMIYVYDQSTIPGGGHLRFKEILEHIESRTSTSPIFRQKLKQVPLALDYPYWVEDENFRIENHVFHVALPKPGDWRQFCILASRLTKPHFDMNRPLWEMYVVEGLDNVDWLPNGSFAILTRMHHAAVDGTAAAQMTWALHDLDARGKKPGAGGEHVTSHIRTPSHVEMATRAWWNNASSPMRLARPPSNLLPKAGRKLLKVVEQRAVHPFEEHSSGSKVPTTRFDGRVSPFRIFCTARFNLDELKGMRQAVADSTINDVVVTIVAGALRRYLDHHGELPGETMVAMMPVNTRPGPDAEPGANNITFMGAAIGTDIVDPKERLAFVQENTARSKSIVDAIGANDLTDINKHIPASLLAATGKLIARIGLDAGGTGKRLFNVAVSNVPGPNVPLYLKGARMRYWSIVAPCTDGMGLTVAVTSYDGEICISPTACREIVPDPEFLTECIEQSYADLLAANVTPPKRRPAKEVAARKAPRKKAARRKATGKKTA